MSAFPPVSLHYGCSDHAWVHYRWPEFRSLDPATTLTIIPVCGLAAWSADLPLNAEESVTMAVLDAALAELGATWPARVIPPMRMVLGPAADAAFGVDPETAHQWLDEVCAAIAASGLRRILFLNSSPANVDLLDAAGRDLRIERGLQMFCINLDGIALQPGSDDAFRTLAEALRSPEPLSSGAASILEARATHLARLLQEIADRPPLPNAGAIPPPATLNPLSS